MLPLSLALTTEPLLKTLFCNRKKPRSNNNLTTESLLQKLHENAELHGSIFINKNLAADELAYNCRKQNESGLKSKRYVLNGTVQLIRSNIKYGRPVRIFHYHSSYWLKICEIHRITVKVWSSLSDIIWHEDVIF